MKSSAITSHTVESLTTNKSPCVEIRYKQIILWRVKPKKQVKCRIQLKKVALERLQLQTSHHQLQTSHRRLQTSHPVGSSATNNSPCGKFSHKSSHPVESSATRNYPVECSVANKSPSIYRFQLQTNHPVESSATNMSPYRMFSYKPTLKPGHYC